MKASSLIIPRDQLNSLQKSLEAAGKGGQWQVVPEAHSSEVVIDGPGWQHQPGEKPVILHPSVKTSIGLPAHLPLEVAHHHQHGVEIYNFRGPTIILIIKFEEGAEVREIELPKGGYFITYPSCDCHWIIGNKNGWDYFYFANQPYQEGDPIDKVTCDQCPLHNQCTLEKLFKFKATQK